MSITGRGRFNIIVTDEYGNIAPGASVEIRTEPGLAAATLFTNRNGTGARANPLTADENGYAFAYAATGHYQLKLSVYGRERILRDVEIGRATTVDATATSFDGTLFVVSPNVGVGTGSPTVPLQVAGSLIAGRNATQHIKISGDGFGNYLKSVSTPGSPKTFVISTDASSAGLEFRTDASASVFWFTNNVQRMRLDTAGRLGIGANAPTTDLHVNGPIRHRTYTVGTLPAAGTVGTGTRAAVTDANATTFNSTVAAGGANFVPVISNGTNWRIG